MIEGDVEAAILLFCVLAGLINMASNNMNTFLITIDTKLDILYYLNVVLRQLRLNHCAEFRAKGKQTITLAYHSNAAFLIYGILSLAVDETLQHRDVVIAVAIMR